MYERGRRTAPPVPQGLKENIEAPAQVLEGHTKAETVVDETSNKSRLTYP